jgi:hypothetical protein
MTQADMYRELIRRNRYGYDDCYPSNRYNESSDVDSNWWKPVDEGYAKTIYECIKKKENHMDYNNTKIFVDGQTYNAYDIEITENYCEYPKITATAYLSPSNMVNAPRKNCTNNRPYPSKPLSIENVIFSPPVTVVLWSDKTKTIVRCDDNYDSFDPEKGLAMAIAKKLMGDNKGKYYNLFKYWRKRWDEKNETKTKVSTPKTPLNDLSEKIKSALNIPSHVIIDDLVPPKE